MQSKQLWYTRRGNEVRGPFPAPQISRFILLGRIKESDELSSNQHDWQKVSDVPVLMPEELKSDLDDPANRERLLIARMREDERSSRQRRSEGNSDSDSESNSESPAVERRQRDDNDRRKNEDEQLIRHREIKTAIAESAKQNKEHHFIRGVFATLLVAGLVGGAWYYQPWQKQDSADCNAPAQPWVNWSNCSMEGVRLVNTDLRGARMRNAKLAGSDFRGSQLGGADLAYTNMVGANLSEAQLSQASLVGANFRNADLSATNLNGANLAYAIFQDANLTGADLTGADLSNADLKGATITFAKIADAKLDKTIWVDGKVCAVGSVGNCN
jgi:uncharacterized protein YjbI with pentapeptide repeats